MKAKYLYWFGATGVALALAAVAGANAEAGTKLKLGLRSRTQKEAGGDQWREVTRATEWNPNETAIIICDLWDKHWCASATRRCGELANGIAPFVEQMRARGVLIVHCPSDTMAFYQESPQRKRMVEAPAAPDAPKDLGRWCRLDPAKEGKLPIDDSDGGCDDQPQCKNYKAWSREHPAVRVAEEDGVTDNGREVFNLFRQRGIKNILYVGVHLNMCVLGRSFAIRQMTQLGFNCALVRDFTDTMYNPRQAPQVSHAEGTQLMIEHVEKHWCPSVLSKEIH